MDYRRIILIVCAIGLALGIPLGMSLGLAAPAEAATKGKKPAASAKVKKHRHHSVAAASGYRYQGGVPAGPLYNGQDYLGNDPDPVIRSQIIRDLGSRYGGPE